MNCVHSHISFFLAYMFKQMSHMESVCLKKKQK